MGPLLRRRPRRHPLPGGRGRPHRPGHEHRAGPGGRVGLLRRLPPPAVLANAIATIDHFSGGRADIGLGAGWASGEYHAYGIPYPSDGARLDILEEAVQCIRGLLRQDRTDFAGDLFTLTDAACDPKPLQAELPIWIGGGGEKRTLAIAARYADGWNIPLVAPEVFAHKKGVLAEHCDRVGRDPAEIRCAVNVGAAVDDAALRAQFGGMTDHARPGCLVGSPDEMVDQVGAFVDAGADQINLSLRAPWDLAVLDHLAAARTSSPPDARRSAGRCVDGGAGAGGGGPARPSQPTPYRPVPVLCRRARGPGALRGEGVPQPLAADARPASRDRPLHAGPRRHLCRARPAGSPAGGRPVGRADRHPRGPRRRGLRARLREPGTRGGRHHPPPPRPDLRLRRDPPGPGPGAGGGRLLALRGAPRRPAGRAERAVGG